MGDELAKAITKIIYPALKPEGFRRVRRKVLIRVENGIAQSLYFQVLSWGGRDFCVTASANVIAAHEHVTLSPGFRLKRDSDGGDLWLPSKTAEEAERSASVVLEAIRADALPYFEKIRTIQGFSAILAKERWASTHHLSFQRGVAAALGGDIPTAQQHLTNAIRLYEEDGRDWCANYSNRAAQLHDALAAGTALRLLTEWEQANRMAYGIA